MVCIKKIAMASAAGSAFQPYNVSSGTPNNSFRPANATGTGASGSGAGSYPAGIFPSNSTFSSSSSSSSGSGAGSYPAGIFPSNSDSSSSSSSSGSGTGNYPAGIFPPNSTPSPFSSSSSGSGTGSYPAGIFPSSSDSSSSSSSSGSGTGSYPAGIFPSYSASSSSSSFYSGSGAGSYPAGIFPSNSTSPFPSPSPSSSSSSFGSGVGVPTINATSSKAARTFTTAANSGIKGFNYGAFFMDYSAKKEVDFAYEFTRAHNLDGTSGWTSARLYTMIQHGTSNTPIAAIPAAISTKTQLLLGLWTSGSITAITNEIAALKAAIEQYGTAFTDLVQGISVGSEDLYRDAQDNPSLPGTPVDNLINYIAQVRTAVAGTTLESIPIGHVDTYDSFANITNIKIIDHLDWIGFDGYPYWESKNANAIENAHELFFTGVNKTNALAAGKPVYITETGWPAVGDKFGAAVANAANSRTYWSEIVCELVIQGINLWYYDLQESQYGQANPDFGIFPAGDLNVVQPRWNVSC